MKRLAMTAAVALLLGGAFVARKGLHAYRSVESDFIPMAAPFVMPSPLEGHQALTLTTRGGLHIAASFAPPKNGVAVVLGHGTEVNRTQLWGDMQLLASAGFGVLAFDWPGHGESEGPITLGRAEREAFTAAVDFLAARPDVERIGAYAFSQGAGLFTVFVADEARVQSLLAVNAWADKVRQVRYEWSRWGLLEELPVEWAVRKYVEGGNVSALELAPKLKGKKALFIVSSGDQSVPPAMSRELAAAAGGQLRIAEGATHTGFREALPDWRATLTGFFAP